MKQNSNGSHTIQNSESSQNEGGGESLLELFGEAKESIEEIYLKIRKLRQIGSSVPFWYTNWTRNNRHCWHQSIRVFDWNSNYESNFHSIFSVSTKVVFMGRSTVINAILNDNILPMGFIHTTRCFLVFSRSSRCFLSPLQTTSEVMTTKPTESARFITMKRFHKYICGSFFSKALRGHPDVWFPSLSKITFRSWPDDSWAERSANQHTASLSIVNLHYHHLAVQTARIVVFYNKQSCNCFLGSFSLHRLNPDNHCIKNWNKKIHL